ncbi:MULTISPECIES: hypothetical protein [Rhizobium]|uniref:hypothetical protein n=1 Tax=Rhizobium TaxID=379 RepID=UPI00119F440D|nr:MULTISPECIES: hypothetical protein [Rhizobium]MCZ3380436.1 hypothetical protein [Rhizobium sp. AG207R]
MPDKTEEYAITISAGMGAIKATPTLTDGWNLTSLSTDVDSKTNENITAITGLLKEAAGIASPKHDFAPHPSAPTKCEGIFRWSMTNPATSRVSKDTVGHQLTRPESEYELARARRCYQAAHAQGGTGRQPTRPRQGIASRPDRQSQPL